MIRSIITAIATTVILFTTALGAAQATEVTTSNDAVDHMDNGDDDGGVSGTLQVIGSKPKTVDGEYVYNDDGDLVMQNVWGFVPFADGPQHATIVHN